MATPSAVHQIAMRSVGTEAPRPLCFSLCFFKDILTPKHHNRRRIPDVPSEPLTPALLGACSFAGIPMPPPTDAFLNPPSRRNVPYFELPWCLADRYLMSLTTLAIQPVCVCVCVHLYQAAPSNVWGDDVGFPSLTWMRDKQTNELMLAFAIYL